MQRRGSRHKKALNRQRNARAKDKPRIARDANKNNGTTTAAAMPMDGKKCERNVLVSNKLAHSHSIEWTRRGCTEHSAHNKRKLLHSGRKLLDDGARVGN